MSWQRRESHLAQFHHHDCYPKRLAIYRVPGGLVLGGLVPGGLVPGDFVAGYLVAGNLDQLRQLPRSTAVDLEVAICLGLSLPSQKKPRAVEAAKLLTLQVHQRQPAH